MCSNLSNLVNSLPVIKDHEKCLDEKTIKGLIKKFPNTYNFCKGDINKFVMLLRKGVYPYEYMESWEKFDETSLTSKKDFYSKLFLEDISDSDYEHAKKVFKRYCKNMGDYHDLYVQTDTLLLADVYKNFRNKCLEIYGLDPSYFYSAPGLAWQACLKKNGVKLELLTDIDMLLMIENSIRGGMCQAIYGYAKSNNKYMKNYDKNQESSYLEYLDANNLYGWTMCKKLLINGFKWVTKLDKFNEDFIKNYNENSNVECFLDVDVEYPINLHEMHGDLPFLPDRKKY